jgi:hypothetical protein
MIKRDTRFKRAFGQTLLTAAILALVATPVAADGRNRTNDLLRDQIFGAFSDADIDRYVRWISGADLEIYPGIMESWGGFTMRADGRAQTLDSIRIYNTGRPPFCVRARARMASGPLVGRLAQSNTGVNMLIGQGESESVVSYSARLYLPGAGELVSDYVVWAPDMSLPERKCSAVAPAWLEQWAAQPATGEDSQVVGELAERR